MITWENYEEYMMMHADGELQAAEVQALMDFVSNHPELKSELALYEATRLSADTTLVYENKESLIKPLPAKRIISFPVWGRYAAAACIAGLLFVSLFKYNSQHNEEQAIVKTEMTTPAVEAPTPKTVAPQNNVAAPQNATIAQQTTEKEEQHKNENAHVKTTTAKQNTEVAVVKTVKKTNERKEVKEEINVPVNTTIAALPTAIIKETPYSTATPTIVVAKDVPVYTQVTESDETENKSFLDKLPIDDIKKKQLGNIAGTISDVYKDITQPAKTGDKKFSIKIEKKRLVLSF